MPVNKFLVSTGFFLAIISIVAAANPSSQFEYECTIGSVPDHVHITIDKAKNNMTNYLFVTTNGSNCSGINDTDPFVLTDCPANKTIEVEVVNPGPSNLIKMAYMTTYELFCDIQTKPVTIVLTANPVSVKSHVSPTHIVPPVKHVGATASTSGLKMTVYPTVVKIGEHLDITIANTDPSVHFRPEKCWASSPKNNYTLWNSKDCKDTDTDLFKGKWIKKGDNVTHGLEAFRFTDSDEVNLKCELKVCEQNGVECTLRETCLQKPAGRRRRRQAVERDTAEVEATFRVSESGQTILSPSSGSGIMVPEKILASFALLMYTALY